MAQAVLAQGRVSSSDWIATHLGGLLLRLGKQRVSGFIDLTIAEKRSRIFLVDGTPTFAEAGADVERWARQLLDVGRIDQPTISEIVAELRASAPPSMLIGFGERLVMRGVVPPDELGSTIEERVKSRLMMCLRARDVDWILYSDDTKHRLPRVALPIERLLVESLEGRAELDVLDVLLRSERDRFPVLREDGSALVSTIGVTPTRLRALRLLDGSRAFAAWLEESPLGRDGSLALLASLVISGRASFSSERRAPRTTDHGSAMPGRMDPVISSLEGTRPRKISEVTTATDPRVPRVTLSEASYANSPSAPPSAPRAVDQLRALLARPGSPSSAGMVAAAPAPPREDPFERGKALWKNGKLGAAKLELARAREMAPQDPERQLYALHVEALVDPPNTERDETIRRLAATIVKEQPQHFLGCVALARIAYAQGDDERARRFYRQASTIDPHDIEVQRHLRLLESRSKK